MGRRPSLEKHKTRNNVFDAFTNRNLFQLASRGLFDEESLSPVMIGKEANIFRARSVSGWVIIKIYRLETCDFNRMYEYLVVDPRYGSLTKKRRETIFTWCRREYANLLKARDAGIPVPAVYANRANILVMESIGGARPAPQLKDVEPEDPQGMGDAIVSMLTRLWCDARLSHGDLSRFNILIDRGEPVFIDFSQAVPLDAPNARLLLERDAQNLSSDMARFGYVISTDAIVELVNQSFKSRERARVDRG
jgi:RIO kinase 1